MLLLEISLKILFLIDVIQLIRQIQGSFCSDIVALWIRAPSSWHHFENPGRMGIFSTTNFYSTTTFKFYYHLLPLVVEKQPKWQQNRFLVLLPVVVEWNNSSTTSGSRNTFYMLNHSTTTSSRTINLFYCHFHILWAKYFLGFGQKCLAFLFPPASFSEFWLS